ncbi:MAG: exodeoxyribonuclease V subunit gamma [Verrucomicrobia bacterium]|nr:exodeoxyribonuclease V subunit gamma [Verrucomicrobiota bacterium]
MAKIPLLFLGNRWDLLVKRLIESIEQDNLDPFTLRLVIVPDGNIKSWVLQQMALHSSRGGVAGIKILSWQEAVRYLLDRTGKELSYLELYLSVYEALQNSSEAEIAQYLEKSPEKLTDLAQELSDLFSTYGYYEPKYLEGDDWQRRLLKKLFVEGPWKMPIQLLDQKVDAGPVYCFGCDFLPPAVWDFLFKLPQLEIFHFSPCSSYWGDVCTDRERRNLSRHWKKQRVSEEKLHELDEYLRDGHPLISNWGKLGRDTLNILDRYELHVEEIYDPLEGAGGLKQLQRDLLLYERSEFLEGDRTLWINQTGSSRLREIQVLRDEVLRAKDRGISFADMSVLAPDLGEYAPLIELVFSDPEFEIPFRMSCIDTLPFSSYWQGFKKLILLSKSRWEVDRLLELFENTAFRKKQGWDLERLDLIRGWIHDARIQWGRNQEQRKTVLDSLLGEETERGLRGTWEEGADRAVQGLVYLFPEDWAEIPSPSPISGVGLGQADELEELFSLLEELQNDLAPLADSSKRSLLSWVQILENLAEKYFGNDESSPLHEIFYAIRYASDVISSEFPFSALTHLFDRKAEGQIGGSLLHAVRFSSLKEGSTSSCRALFVIGLDEESFPRKNTPSSLDLMRGQKNGPPTASEKDRYLFLQAILSATDQICISYGHISPEDGKDIGPSILVQELQTYLNKKVSTVTHPGFALHVKCFQEPFYQSRSRKAFRAAKIYYGSKEPLEFWRPFDYRPEVVLPEGEITLSLRDLAALFRQPWKFYLQKVMNFSFEEEEDQNWEDFEIDFKKRAQILRSSLKQPLEEVIDTLDQKNRFPVGLFGEMARTKLEETHAEWKENLKGFGLENEALRTLRLRDMRDGEFDFPPIQLEWDRLKVQIQGEIKLCTVLGPVHVSDDALPSFLRSWPEHLAALVALQTKSIFPLKKGVPKIVESPLKALRKCVELYFLGLQTPLPLVSEWADPILRKTSDELQKKIENPETRIPDIAFDWVNARIGKPNAEAIFTAWGNYLREALGELINLYPTRGKNGEI